jgi:hypothetical protein
MSQTIDEQLSALLDGELLQEEEELLLRRLEREPECRDTLSRYSLIGELLQDAAANPDAAGLGERVRAALDDDAAGPETLAGGIDTRLGATPKMSTGWRTFGKGLAGAGIAAAAAALALNSLLSREPEPGFITPVAAQIGPGYTVPDTTLDNNAIARVRLTNYLVSHREFSNAASRRTMDSHIVRQTSGSSALDQEMKSADE